LQTYQLKKAEGAYVPFQNPVTKNIWIGKSNGLAYLDANEEIRTLQISRPSMVPK
jgi:hypothetical protein